MHLLRFALPTLLAAASLGAQDFDWIHVAPASERWSLAGNWSPAGPPTTGSNVTVDRFGQPFLSGPTLDQNASLSNLTLTNNAFFGAYAFGDPATASRTLDVTGFTTLGTGIANAVSAIEGCTYSLGTLSAQGNATLLRGVILGVGTGFHPELGDAVIQWRGANVVRNEGSIGLGPNGYLRDQNNGLDALRNLTENGGDFGVVGRSFTTTGSFSNFGLLSVTINDFIYQFARLQVGGTFVNFDANTGVLNGGTLWLRGKFGGRAEFAFPNADIRTLAPNTAILLEGDAAILDSLTGENGLRHLGDLGGNLSVANALGLTPANGTLMHVQGSLDVLTNGHITVVGDLQQFNGTQTHVGQGGPGTARLVITGRSNISSRFLLDGAVGEDEGETLFEALEHFFDVDSEVGGTGTIRGQTTISGTFGPITIPIDLRPRLTPVPELLPRFVCRPEAPRAVARPQGATIPAPGRLRVVGNLSFAPSATFSVSLTGLTPGSEYSVLEQSGADGKGVVYGVTLGGQLQVQLAAGFAPPPNAVFAILSANLLGGEFVNVVNGRVSAANGAGSFRVQRSASGDRQLLILTDFTTDPFTVFTGGEKADPQSWGEFLNWDNDTPGSVAFNLLIPTGYFTRSTSTYAGLDRLQMRAGSGHALATGTTLEFRRGVVLESASGASTHLGVEGPGLATLATNALLSLGREANDGGAESTLSAGLQLVPSGSEASPMSITKLPGGTLRLDGPVVAFRGSTLTLNAQSSTATGSSLQLNGGITEWEPNTPSKDGAAVVVEGGGIVRLSNDSFYNGGTIVRNSATLFPGGASFSGGLSVENTFLSATGDGPVLVTATAGTSAETDNFGILSGNGRIGGSVTFEGSVFLPGNSAFAGTAVGTIRLGGDLTLRSGPIFGGGSAGSAVLIDLDPQNSNPALRSDLILLDSPVAQVQLESVGLGLFLKSPPQPGGTYRFLDAPNSSNAVTGSFLGLLPGSTASSEYFGVQFGFQIQYGPNYVQLTHFPPLAQDYAYRRVYFFSASELENDPVRTGPFADFNGDGVSNFLAYAVGGDPHFHPGAKLPQASTRPVSGTPYGVIEIRRPFPAPADVRYLVAESADLTTGFGAPIDLDDSAHAARVLSRTANGDGTETVVVRATAPLSAQPHLFLRLVVEVR